ncbi:MAG: insulinase family protein [Candidatus Omnitrophica bacterium]|jgi:predicted Zn-dependent peptidase|nr:insulinase family protein [Candidatus Omnitrophota bacterium]
MYQKTTFDNGLRLVTAAMPRMRSASLGIFIKVGGRNEEGKIKGAAHFIEHLLFKGSKKYSCRRLKEAIEGVGGTLNGFTSEEVTCYLVKTPAEHLDTSLDVLSDMVLNPLFLASEIEKERTVILEEIKMYQDLPQSYVHELLDNILWPRHPLGESILGSVETISAMKRSDILDFKKTHYNASNIVISACGKVGHEKLARKFKTIFSGLKRSEPNGYIVFKPAQKEPALNILNKDTAQVHLALGFHSLEREHPLRYALGLLNIILGGNMSSRLFEQVREKRGLAYEIASTAKRFQDTGAFVVHAGVDNNKLFPALELIFKELKKIKNNYVSQDELRRSKDFYLGQLSLAFEETMDSMLWIGESSAVCGKIYKLNQVIDKVKKVSLGQINEVARIVFQEKYINLALIGDLKGKEAKIKERLSL